MMECSSQEKEIIKTKHHEYSLLLATLLIINLPFLFPYFVGNSYVLWVIFFAGFLCLIWNIFSIYRHLDVLAHRLSAGKSLLLITGISNIIFVGMVEMLMVTNPISAELLLRENVFSMVMILFGGITGVICFIIPRNRRARSLTSSLYPYLGLLFVISVMLFILPGTFVESGFSKIQLVIVVFFCLVSYGGLIFSQSQEKRKILFFENEDTTRGVFSVGCCSPFSKAWHGGWLVIHIVALFSILWVLSPYLRQTIGLLAQSAQWFGFFSAFALIFPFGRGMITYTQDGKAMEGMTLGIFYLLSKMILGIPMIVGIAIWLNQEIALAFSLPQTILLISGFLLFGFFSLVFEEENYQKIMGIAHLGLLVAGLLTLC